MGTKGRTYVALDENRVRDNAARQHSKFDSILKPGTKTLKMVQGLNVLRVIRHSGQKYWSEVIWAHGRVGAKKSSYLCAKKMREERLIDGPPRKCPICDAADEALANGDQDEAKQLKPRERAIAYVIHRDHEKDGVLVWEMAWGMQQEVDQVSTPRRGPCLDIGHIDIGYDLTIIRNGSGLNTRYTGLQIDRESTPLSDRAKEQDAWHDECAKNPLMSLLNFYEPEYLEGILKGTIEERDEDEDGDERKPARGRDRDDDRRSTRGRDDDDEPREPARRSRSRDDEDSNDHDHEEDEVREWRNGRDRNERSARQRDDDERSTRHRDDDEDERKPSRTRDRDDDEPRSRRRSDDDEDEQPRQARRSRGEPEEREDTDPPPRRRGRDDDPDDSDPPWKGRANSRARDDDDDRKPTRARGDEDDDRTAHRRRDDDDDHSPRGRDDDDRKPARTRDRDDDDDDRKPARNGNGNGGGGGRKRVTDDTPLTRRARSDEDEDGPRTRRR